ncbi:MAG: AMP-binding protein, partial [Pseudomonadota bacterium]
MLETLRKAQREFTYVKGVYGVLKKLKVLQPDSPVLIADEFEQSVDAYPDQAAFVFEGETTSYRGFDERANTVAHWALEQDLKPGDAVALIMENTPDYPAIWYGLSKVGVVAALINTNLEGEGLAHCISIVDSKAVIASGVQASRAMAVAPSISNDLKVWDMDG